MQGATAARRSARGRRSDHVATPGTRNVDSADETSHFDVLREAVVSELRELGATGAADHLGAG